MSRRDDIRRNAEQTHLESLNRILSSKQNSNQGEPIVTSTVTTEGELAAILAAIQYNLNNGIVPNTSQQRFAECKGQVFRLEQGAGKPTLGNTAQQQRKHSKRHWHHGGRGEDRRRLAELD